MPRRFEVTSVQWSRFVDNAMPKLAELLTAGFLNAVADEVDLVAGNRRDDIRCRIGDDRFTVEVKTAWWHDREAGVVGHSPLRANQDSNLVALVGRFDVDESSPTLRRIDSTGLTIEPDRMFYLVPTSVIRLQSTAHGKAKGRALIPRDVVQLYEVDLTQEWTQRQLLRLISSDDSRNADGPVSGSSDNG